MEGLRYIESVLPDFGCRGPSVTGSYHLESPRGVEHGWGYIYPPNVVTGREWGIWWKRPHANPVKFAGASLEAVLAEFVAHLVINS